MPSNLGDGSTPVKHNPATSPGRQRPLPPLHLAPGRQRPPPPCHLGLGPSISSRVRYGACVAEPSKDTVTSDKGLYTSFDAFLKQAIREYYDRSWTTRRGNFIALLIGSGSTSFALAKDSMVDGSGTKKVAIGAGLLIALRVGLKYAIGGPLGLVMSVAAGASMIAYFVRNQKDIIKKVGLYKALIADSHKRYEEVQTGWRDGKYAIIDRNLMIDGLMKQFITQVDEA